MSQKSQHYFISSLYECSVPKYLSYLVYKDVQPNAQIH